MEQAIHQGIFGVLDLSGRMRRGAFWTLVSMVVVLEMGFQIILMATTRHEPTFAFFFWIFAVCNVVVAVFLFSAFTKRIRDAGGHPLLPAAFMAASALLCWYELEVMLSPGYPQVSDTVGWGHRFAEISVFGFGCAVFLLVFFPSHRKLGTYLMFEDEQKYQGFAQLSADIPTSVKPPEPEADEVVFKSVRSGASG